MNEQLQLQNRRPDTELSAEISNEVVDILSYQNHQPLNIIA